MKKYCSVQDRSPYLAPLLPRLHYSSIPYPPMLPHLPSINFSRLPTSSHSSVFSLDTTDHWKEHSEEPLDYSMSSTASSSHSYAEADSSISFDMSSPPMSPSPTIGSSSPPESSSDSPENCDELISQV